jgi:hypothetical protein
MPATEQALRMMRDEDAGGAGTATVLASGTRGCRQTLADLVGRWGIRIAVSSSSGDPGLHGLRTNPRPEVGRREHW